MTIAALLAAYRRGALDPGEVVGRARARAAAAGAPAWISVISTAQLEERLATLGDPRAPLHGIPFAVKDNIDAAGLPTTAGCPAFARAPGESAHAVALLEAAGAVVIGKTNLDQFATGLTGSRSPYGACASVVDPRYVSGGSSSGSAVVVADGTVPLALGTDTAGSGRVPAAFNEIVGLKPTRGSVSVRGVVPACRSLDCVSVFTRTVGDAARVFGVIAHLDPAGHRGPGPRRTRRAAVPDGAHPSDARRRRRRTDRTERRARYLHELRQPAGPVGDRDSGGAPRRRPALRCHADGTRRRRRAAAGASASRDGSRGGSSSPACRPS